MRTERADLGRAEADVEEALRIWQPCRLDLGQASRKLVRRNRARQTRCGCDGLEPRFLEVVVDRGEVYAVNIDLGAVLVQLLGSRAERVINHRAVSVVIEVREVKEDMVARIAEKMQILVSVERDDLAREAACVRHDLGGYTHRLARVVASNREEKRTGEVKYHELDDVVAVADERVFGAERSAGELDANSHIDVLEVDILIPEGG
jgi:hypothetical protein